MALTERLAIDIVANAGTAIAEFKKVGAAAKGLDGSVTGGSKGLGKLGQAGTAAGNMLKANVVGGAVAATGAIVAFGVSSVRAVQDLDAAVLKFQRSSGATTEEASFLIAAFDDMGISAETGTKAIFQLGKRVETSDKALAAFGITAVKNNAGNTDMVATLMKTADAYVATTDPARRAALLTAAFGKSGADMIPLLEKGSAGIAAFYKGAKDTGQIRTPEQVLQTEKLRVALDNLGDAANELKLATGTALVPTLTFFADAISLTIEWAEKLRTVNGLLGETNKPVSSPGGFLDQIKNKALGLKPPLEEVTGGLGDFGAGLIYAGNLARPFVEANEEADKALDDLSKALFATADADRALTDAHRDVTSAQAALNKLMKEGAVDEEKVANARTSLAEATRSLADANRGVSKAQKDYDEAVANAAALGGLDSALDKVADAGENLADAQDTQASASERARDAAKDLRDAQAGDPEFQDKLAAAKQKVADATFDLSQKSLASVTAHNNETEALKLHADEVQRLYDKNAALIAQNPGLLPALAPIQNALAGPTFTGGGDFPAGGPATTFGPGGATTTNNITVNATTTDADARLIAKEVMWNLN